MGFLTPILAGNAWKPEKVDGCKLDGVLAFRLGLASLDAETTIDATPLLVFHRI